jgi:hypothetical protein
MIVMKHTVRVYCIITDPVRRAICCSMVLPRDHLDLKDDDCPSTFSIFVCVLLYYYVLGE